MRIAVCDDERMYSSILERIILQWATYQEQIVFVNVYQSGEDFLEDFENGIKFDMVFLDIQMGGMSGLEVGKRIRQWDMSLLIVFCTNFRDYVFEGYEVSALRYLIKPVKEKKCIETLNIAAEVCRKKRIGHYTIQTETETHRIAKSDITYISTAGHYIYVHTAEDCYKFRGKLATVEKDFSPPMYAKCNRGIIVNVDHISCITREKVTLLSSIDLPMSRLYFEDLNRCYLAVHVEPFMFTHRKTPDPHKE